MSASKKEKGTLYHLILKMEKVLCTTELTFVL